MNNEITFYTTPDGKKKVQVVLQNETAWLTQKALAELFGVQVPSINKHLKNIFESGGLVENPVISILETTTAYGKTYNVGEKMNKLSSPLPHVFAFKCVYQAVERNEG